MSIGIASESFLGLLAAFAACSTSTARSCASGSSNAQNWPPWAFETACKWRL
jgi:hypothetical protein